MDTASSGGEKADVFVVLDDTSLHEQQRSIGADRGDHAEQSADNAIARDSKAARICPRGFTDDGEPAAVVVSKLDVTHRRLRAALKADAEATRDDRDRSACRGHSHVVGGECTAVDIDPEV